ncbi:class I SAM-dependent methyltransferase [Halorubrum tebenquichense]|uniref:class I SAM-dependent methyltransferase n=1 Tax=Halorubrum tebenquichense TaxID=119434 RepID=UPI000677712E|nr:class I SAM-dependent methyltransferase [Halorubrum tebenquichense]
MTDPYRENRRLWDEWSDAFQALWNAETATDAPPTPSPFGPDAPDPERVVPAVESAAVAELGCGGGQGTVGAALAGADRAVGVDLSREQLRHARRLREYCGVDATFVHGEATSLPLATDAFDVAFTEWAFQHVADLDAALREARRVLRDGGTFLCSVPHPFGEVVDGESGEVDRRYHGDSRRTVEIDESYDADMVVFDRPVGDLHRALVDAGFAVDAVVEPDPLDHAPNVDGGPAAAVPRDLRLWATAT